MGGPALGVLTCDAPSADSVDEGEAGFGGRETYHQKCGQHRRLLMGMLLGLGSQQSEDRVSNDHSMDEAPLEKDTEMVHLSERRAGVQLLVC